MALTSHIKQGSKSPIGEFLLARFPSTIAVTKETNRQLRTATTLRLPDHTPSHVYATLGTALDYRIRYYFPIAPKEQLIAWQGGMNLHIWVMEEAEGVADVDPVWELIEAFFDSLEAILARIQPYGRRLPAIEEELLARYCYVLALFEILGRSGWTPDSPYTELALVLAEKRNVEELLAIPQGEWVQDLCEMSWLFYDACSDLLSQPAVLNPTFDGSHDVGGADADLIVGGCLIELKTSINPTVQSWWLRQLAGYVLLDYNDVYGSNTVGLYMARQGMLFTWTVEDFLRTLANDPSASIMTLRHQFHTCCSASANTEDKTT